MYQFSQYMMNIRFRSMVLLLAMQCSCLALDSFGQACISATYNKTAVSFISVDEAWQMVRTNSLPLKIKEKTVEAALGDLQQERLFDNPEISITHNVNNPVTHRYFETNGDGETDIQLSQRIYIGGQRGERIRKTKAEVRRLEYERDDLSRQLRRDLCSTMVVLSSMRRKAEIIEKEICSVEKILKAYKEQSAKGNVAPVEVVRIQSQLMQLSQEKVSLDNEMSMQEKQLRLMIGTDRDRNDTCNVLCGILIPKIDYEASVAQLSKVNKNDIVARLSERADILSGKQDIVSSEHDVKLQKANALPEVSLTGEWDKNGNIGHNFFSVGLSFTLPVFNRNQGGMKAAKASLEAKRIQYELNYRQAQLEIENGWDRLINNKKMAQEISRHLENDNEQMMSQMETQYMKRNVSLLELIDYYQVYKDNNFLYVDSQKDVLLSMIELDMNIK